MKEIGIGIAVVLTVALVVLVASVRQHAATDRFANETERSVGGPSRANHRASPLRSVPSSIASPSPSDEEGGIRSPQPLRPPTATEAVVHVKDVLDRSGSAAGDELDAIGADLGNRIATEIRSLGAHIAVDRFECRKAGCVAVYRIAPGPFDLNRATEVAQGIPAGAAVLTWPGSRITSPPIADGPDKLLYVFLVRPDATDNFSM